MMKRITIVILGLMAAFLYAGEWKVFNWPEKTEVEPGSALDVSKLIPEDQSPNAWGNIIAAPGGFLALEKRPEQPLRFLCNSITENGFQVINKNQPEFVDHPSIERFVKELKLRGYNMVRTHFLDLALIGGRKSANDFDPKVLDRFDYLVYQLKKNNMYLCFDAMTSWLGYTPGNIWDRAGIQYRNYKYSIHFDRNIRENWRAGTEKIISRVNPYTGTRLVDDPVMPVIVGYNEHEIGFFYSRNKWELATPAWLSFLEKKYGTIEKLNQAWSDEKKSCSYKNFNEAPMFSSNKDFGGKSPLPARKLDYIEFATRTETETSEWMQSELKKMGYKGLYSSFNCGKNLRFTYVRRNMDLVTANTYHAHPGPGHISQASSIGNSAQTAREFFSMRIADRPMAITEHAHVFWNKYRYEQGFITGGYSALHNFSVLTVHCNPVSIRERGRISSFSMANDPIHKAEELVTFFVFVRGDVKAAQSMIRANAAYDSLPAMSSGMNPWQSRLGLVTGFGMDFLKNGETKNLKPGERSLPVSTGGEVVSELAYSSILERTSNAEEFDKYIVRLKNEKFIPSDNQTLGAKGIYQSVTGQLLLNSRHNFMTIDTPMFQGICSEAGANVTLSNVEISGLTTRGNVNVISIDGKIPLQSSRRILIVYATNALNSNMKFTDPKTMVRLEKMGTTPTILETGVFSMKIGNSSAEKWELYALDTNGKRLEKLPVLYQNGKIVLSIDTAKLRNGPSLFFELTAK